MPRVGILELDAVNQILEAGGVKPVTAVPSTEDGSPARSAFNTLERIRVLTLLEGYGRTLKNVVLQRSTSTIFVDGTAPNNAIGPLLHVAGAGPDSHRNFSIDWDGTNAVLYDLDANTATFAADVTANAVPDDDFDKISPSVRELITARARRRFQMATKRSTDMDAIYATEVASLEMTLPRYSVNGAVMPVIAPPRASDAMIRLQGMSRGDERA